MIIVNTKKREKHHVGMFRINGLCNNLSKNHQDERFRCWRSIFKMVEIEKLHRLSVIWNCCQSFGWLYLAVLNVVKLFCSLLLLWHEWQCIVSVNNRMLVWLNWLLNSLLPASHSEGAGEVAVQVAALPYSICYILQQDRLVSSIPLTNEIEVKLIQIKKKQHKLVFLKKCFE